MSAIVHNWEVLNGVGVDGVGVIFPFFNACFRFSSFFFAFLFFSQRARASNSNLLQKWGVSLRPRLHGPRAKLSDTIAFFSEDFLLLVILLVTFNSVQTRCIVKGEAQKSPLFWRFSGGF